MGIECGRPFPRSTLGKLGRPQISTNRSPVESELLCDGALRESSSMGLPHRLIERSSLLAAVLMLMLVLIQLSRTCRFDSFRRRRLLVRVVENGWIRWRGFLRNRDLLQYV